MLEYKITEYTRKFLYSQFAQREVSKDVLLLFCIRVELLNTAFRLLLNIVWNKKIRQEKTCLQESICISICFIEICSSAISIMFH